MVPFTPFCARPGVGASEIDAVLEIAVVGAVASLEGLDASNGVLGVEEEMSEAPSTFDICALTPSWTLLAFSAVGVPVTCFRAGSARLAIVLRAPIHSLWYPTRVGANPLRGRSK